MNNSIVAIMIAVQQYRHTIGSFLSVARSLSDKDIFPCGCILETIQRKKKLRKKCCPDHGQPEEVYFWNISFDEMSAYIKYEQSLYYKAKQAAHYESLFDTSLYLFSPGFWSTYWFNNGIPETN